ncbi:hypothetical protein [Legionella sp.]|uniref:hypothetical protein n=1 Tax=Legionella sp. TaxID=459 RepID=UPI003D13BB3C
MFSCAINAIPSSNSAFLWPHTFGRTLNWHVPLPPWFLFNEHQPDALKRNLKLLRKLNKSYANIVAKNGEFTATSKNLTQAQEIDMTLDGKGRATS